MKPYAKDFEHVRGDYFEYFFRIRGRVWNPALNGGAGGWEAGSYRDLTDWTGIFQVRADLQIATPVMASGVVSFTDQVAVPGGVWLIMEAVESINLAISTTNKYDVQLTDELGKPRTYLSGNFITSGDVSRAS